MNLVLNLTEHCNLRCSYCYYRDTGSLQTASTKTLEQAIDFGLQQNQQRKHNWLNITFFGGEPLLEKKNLFHAVDYALSHQGDTQIGFAINTNGTLFDEATLLFLHKHQFRIFLSLDGPASTHDKQRPQSNGQGSHHLIHPWLPQLAHMKTTILRVIDPQHLNGLAESIQWLVQQGFHSITTAPNYNGQWTEENFDFLQNEYQKIAQYWLQWKQKQPHLYLGTFQDKIRLQLERQTCRETTCAVGVGALAIGVDGSVYPCTRFVDIQNPQHPWRLGHINTGLNDEKMQALQSYLKTDKESCRDCSLKDRCHGNGCACIAWYTMKNIYEVSAEVCTHETMVAEIADQLALKLLEV